MSKIENSICEAIELIVDKKVNSAKYDKTVRATIKSCEDEVAGKYKVNYQDSTFYAYSTSTDVTYSANTAVYVLIPGNDMHADKTILGTVDKLGLNYIPTPDKQDLYDTIGTNCIEPSDVIFELSSYHGTQEVKIYPSNLVKIDIQSLNEYIKQSSSLMCGAVFQTSIPEEQQYQGNFGIIFGLDFQKNSSEEISTKYYVIDIDNMIGNPYRQIYGQRQYEIFDIDGANFKQISSISIFANNFPHKDETQPKDIKISNLEISGMKIIPQEEIDNGGISFYTPDGTIFLPEQIQDSLRITAQLKVKGKAVNATASKLPFYWYEEDISVSSKSDFYNKYGGRGWRCLNEKRIVAPAEGDTPAQVEWIPASQDYLVKRENVRSKLYRLKCVVVYNNSIYSKTLYIKNLVAPNITIESDSGTKFYYDLGNPTLTCKIDNVEKPQYTYKWAIEDAQGQLTMLKKEDGVVVNKLVKYPVSKITSTATFKCSIYDNNILLGTGSIILTNSIEGKEGITLSIVNGTQVYQYDEFGVSPASPSLENPIQIPVLSFAIIDQAGNAVSEDILRTCKAQWRIPLKKTLIYSGAIDGTLSDDEEYKYYSGFELNYGIQNRYSQDYINNDIQLVVNYKNTELIANTNFTFVKQGDPGTNGTNYIGKIVPNTKGEKPLYPSIIAHGSDWKWNFDIEKDKSPFKVELYRSGEKVFEGSQSDTSTIDNTPVTLEWEILQNKYKAIFGQKKTRRGLVKSSPFETATRLSEDQIAALILSTYGIVYNSQHLSGLGASLAKAIHKEVNTTERGTERQAWWDSARYGNIKIQTAETWIHYAITRWVEKIYFEKEADMPFNHGPVIEVPIDQEFTVGSHEDHAKYRGSKPGYLFSVLFPAWGKMHFEVFVWSEDNFSFYYQGLSEGRWRESWGGALDAIYWDDDHTWTYWLDPPTFTEYENILVSPANVKFIKRVVDEYIKNGKASYSDAKVGGIMSEVANDSSVFDRVDIPDLTIPDDFDVNQSLDDLANNKKPWEDQIKDTSNGEDVYIKDENDPNKKYPVTETGIEKWIQDPSNLTIVKENGIIKYKENKGSSGDFANIVKCTITYGDKGEKQTIYTTLPITIINTQPEYEIKRLDYSGYDYAYYAGDGTHPNYKSSNPFALEILKNGQTISAPKYEWSIKGAVYDYQKNIFTASENLKQGHKDYPANQYDVRPSRTYDGVCVSNAVECICKDSETEIGRILIPIHLYLNKYGFAHLNGWDGNSIEINEEGGFILSPQIGAGTKNQDNAFTGLLMGEVQEARSVNKKIGLVGFSDGVQSIFLDADTGKTELGKIGSNQIVIDPRADKALIQSGNFDTKAGTGLQIDFSTPTITFGSKDFVVDAEGHITAKGGGSIGGWKIDDYSLMSSDKQTGLNSINQVSLAGSKIIDDKAIAFWAGGTSNPKFYVSHDGYFKSTSGSIGGWNISSTGLTDSTENNYINTDGTGKLGKMTWDTSGTTFEGTVTAAEIEVTKGGTKQTFELGTVMTSTISATELNAQHISANTASIGSLNVTTANITERLTAAEGSITSLSSANVTITNRLTAAEGSIASFDTIYAKKSYVDSLEVTHFKFNGKQATWVQGFRITGIYSRETATKIDQLSSDGRVLKKHNVDIVQEITFDNGYMIQG